MSAKVRNQPTGRIGGEWMNEVTAAKYAKLTRQQVRGLRERKEVTVRLVGKYVEYSKASLDAFLKSATVPATKQPRKQKPANLQPAA